MRTKRLLCLYCILLVIFLLLIVGCPFGIKPPLPPPENSEDSLLTEYRKVLISDLTLLNENYDGPVDMYTWPEDLKWEMDSLVFGLGAVVEALGRVQDAITYTPRTMDALFSIRITDEGFIVTDTTGSNDVIEMDFNLEYLDLLLQGKINSLSNMLAVIEYNQLPEIDLEAEVKAGLSLFLEGTSELAVDVDMLLSLYADFKIAAVKNTLGLDTNKLSLNLQLSFGTNYVMGPEYRVPLVIEFDLLPLEDVDVDNVDEAMSSDPTVSATAWQDFTELLWGKNHEDDCITITRKIVDEDGITHTKTWTGREAVLMLIDTIDK